MNCAFDKEKLTGYYDGELEAAEKAEVERHIASCSECLRDLGELKSAALLVKELPRLRAPRSIAECVSREIAVSGKVHVLAKFRRNLMWAAAAAAGILVMMNVIYLSNRGKPESESLAKTPMPASAAPLAEVPATRDALQDKLEADRAHLREEKAKAEPAEVRKNALDADEKKQQLGAKAEESRRALDAAGGNRERGAKDLAKSGEAKPAEPPAPPAAKPSAPPAPAPVAAAKEEPKAPAAPVAPAPTPEKPAAQAKREEDPAAAQKDAEQMKLKQATLDGKFRDAANADAAPTHLTLACVQPAKMRPQLEEALGKLGCQLPPPLAPMKGMKSMAREDATIAVELTDSQIAKLQKDFEKQGEAKLVVGAPEDPIVLNFLRGGSLVFGRRDVAAAGAGAPARKKSDAPTEEQKEKEADPAPVGKAAAEGAADKAPEPRRKVIFHVAEVKPAPPPK